MNQEQNLDMFGLEGLNLDDIDHVIESDDLKGPENLRQFYGLLKTEVEKANADPALAIVILDKLCNHFGGFPVYLPKGKTLRAELQNLRIYSEFKGDNIEDLARKYKISVQHAYRVVKIMRHREIAKKQPSLF